MTQVYKHPSSPRQVAAKSGPLDRLLNPHLFKALCDPTRLKLVACIAKCGRGCSVGEIAACCSVDLSVVSRHLKALEVAGVLTSSKSGRTVRYEVRYSDLATILRNLADAFEDCCPCGPGCGCAGSSCDVTSTKVPNRKAKS